MTKRRLLFLDANRLTSYGWQRGQIEFRREFALDGSGAEAFSQYLARHENTVFSILADVAEEGYQIEDVPHVAGKDRDALITRRLAQYFYGTPYSMAISLGREKTGRRDEKLLFAALTQSRHFETWLNAMRNSSAQLSGIYSAPQALSSLLKHSGKLKGQQLVLSITRSGVRQTFFNDGKLYFSRLTTLATGSIEESAVACAVEARKTYQYLIGQRLINRSTALQVLLLAHPAQTNTFRAHCRPSSELNFEFPDLLAESKKAKLKTPLPDSKCEMLLLHEIANHQPAQQFAPTAERHFYRLWQARTALTAAAAIVFISCLLFAGKQYFNANALNNSTLEFEEQKRADQNKYDAALKALPPTPASTDDVRALVNRFQDMDKRSPLLESTLIPLSRALTATPGIEIQRLDWQLSEKRPTTAALVSGAFKQPPLAVSGSYYIVTEVDAQLPVALINDHRAMLALLNQFVAELGKEKSLGVQVTQLPFDVESGKTIKSSAEDSPVQSEPPKFSFRLIQGL